MRFLFALAMLIALPANAGQVSGRVALYAPSSAEACDTLGVVVGVEHVVHARIMQGATQAWEDSVSVWPGSAWELDYPALGAGSYQISSWTTKQTNRLIGCPAVLSFTIEPEFSIVFGWTTVGAVYSNTEKRVIGAAEMLRLLNARDSTKARP